MPHSHLHDPRMRMGAIPEEILQAVRKRAPVLFPHSFSRRDAVRLLSLAGVVGLSGCGNSKSVTSSSSSGTTTSTGSGSSTACTRGTSTTEGPYWVDGDTASPKRADIRADTITTAKQNGYNGVALSLNFAVYTYSSNGCTPLENARVDVWHCDAQGIYSDEASQNETSLDYSEDNFLRGYQLSDANGLVSFSTIFPGWYTGRTTHIHLRIRTYDSSGNVSINSTTQVFFDDAIATTVYGSSSYYSRSKTRDTYNTNDSIYQSSLLMSVSGSVSDGYSNTLYGIGLPFSS